MDLHEHGISAYPEYVISSLGAPAGMAKETVLPAPSAVMSTIRHLSHSRLNQAPVNRSGFPSISATPGSWAGDSSGLQMEAFDAQANGSQRLIEGRGEENDKTRSDCSARSI